jgi:hypothetical protein
VCRWGAPSWGFTVDTIWTLSSGSAPAKTESCVRRRKLAVGFGLFGPENWGCADPRAAHAGAARRRGREGASGPRAARGDEGLFQRQSRGHFARRRPVDCPVAARKGHCRRREMGSGDESRVAPGAGEGAAIAQNGLPAPSRLRAPADCCAAPRRHSSGGTAGTTGDPRHRGSARPTGGEGQLLSPVEGRSIERAPTVFATRFEQSSSPSGDRCRVPRCSTSFSP